MKFLDVSYTIATLLTCLLSSCIPSPVQDNFVFKLYVAGLSILDPKNRTLAKDVVKCAITSRRYNESFAAIT